MAKTVLDSETYDEELLTIVGNADNWPIVLHQTEINRLFDIAFDAYDQKTSYGYIASVLIWHQIIEHLTVHLIELSYLYIKAEIWPTRINLEFDSSKSQMFGKYEELLNKTIEFRDKQEFIRYAHNFNTLRIQFVHKLALLKNEKSIEKIAEKAKFLFTQKILFSYQNSVKNLYAKLEDLNNRVDFNELVSDMGWSLKQKTTEG